MVINKYLTGSTPVTLSLGNFTGNGTAQVWQLTASNTISAPGGHQLFRLDAEPDGAAAERDHAGAGGRVGKQPAAGGVVYRGSGERNCAARGQFRRGRLLGPGRHDLVLRVEFRGHGHRHGEDGIAYVFSSRHLHRTTDGHG